MSAGGDAEKGKRVSQETASEASAEKIASQTDGPHAQPVRAINEDDDGYDPYSDLHDRAAAEPLFEPDPWD